MVAAVSCEGGTARRVLEDRDVKVGIGRPQKAVAEQPAAGDRPDEV